MNEIENLLELFLELVSFHNLYLINPQFVLPRLAQESFGTIESHIVSLFGREIHYEVLLFQIFTK